MKEKIDWVLSITHRNVNTPALKERLRMMHMLVFPNISEPNFNCASCKTRIIKRLQLWAKKEIENTTKRQ